MLTARQKAEIVKTNPNVGVYMLLQKMEADLEKRDTEREKEFKIRLDKMETEVRATLEAVRSMKKGDKPVLGVDYTIRHGETPSEEDLISLIKPLIPKVKNGKTPTQEELERLIKPLIPKVANVEEVASLVLTRLTTPKAPSAEGIANMVLNKLSERKISVSDIEGLDQRLTKIYQNINTIKQRKSSSGGGAGGGMPNWVYKSFTGDGVTTQFTLDYKVAGGGAAIINIVNGQPQELGYHYSVSNSSGKGVVTFTTAPYDGAPVFIQHARA